MKIRLFFLLFYVLFCGRQSQAFIAVNTSTAQTQIILTNPTAVQRHEVVEVHHVTLPQPFILRDAYGIEQPYQVTHDGRLLLFASVRPYGTATYTLEPGTPAPMKRFVSAKLYPERLDDIVIENDRTGYRFYGPALQRKGERGFGIDVWLKNTPELVIDDLYRLEFSLHPEIARLREQGRLHEADSLTTLTSFHLNHGKGMDCYNVGPTLGCGTPALITGDELHFPWCYDSFRIIDDGPLRVSLQMDFAPVVHSGISANPVSEHRLVTLDRGSNFCRLTVWYTGLEQPTDVAAGFVIHEADTTSVVLGPDYVHYADPTGDALRQNCQIYVATLFPDGIDSTRKLLYATPSNGNAGHAFGIHRALANDEPFTYYFGSAWSQYDVRSQDEWQLRLRDFLTCRRHPVTVQVQGHQSAPVPDGSPQATVPDGSPSGIAPTSIKTYAAPAEVELKRDFAVRVRSCDGGEWQEVPTYAVKVDHVDAGRHRTELSSVAQFDFSGNVEVEVTSLTRSIDSVRIRPQFPMVLRRVEGNKVTFCLNRPRYLSIEVNGDIYQNLQLFANEMQPQLSKRALKSKQTIYFGPGLHKLEGDSLVVRSGQTVFIDGGAVVKGWLAIDDASDVQVLGHGVIDPGRHEGIMVRRSRRVLIDGPLTTQIPVGGSDSVTIRNAKVISSYGWGDGMNVFASSNISYDHVFCRTSDDCSTIYCTRKGYRGSCRNIRVHDAVYWADVAHPIMIGLHGDIEKNETIEDVLYDDIDILENPENQIDYKGCIGINNGDNILVKGLTFQNIRVESLPNGMLMNLRVCWNQKYCNAPGRGIEDVTFRNITYRGVRPQMSIISGYNEQRRVRNVRFENLNINGRVISDDMPDKLKWYKTADYADIFIGEHVDAVTFGK